MRIVLLTLVVAFSLANKICLSAEGDTEEPAPAREQAPAPVKITVVGGLCGCGQMVGSFDAAYQGRSIEVDFTFHSPLGSPLVKIYRKAQRLPLSEGIKLVCGEADRIASCAVTGTEVTLVGSWTEQTQFHADQIVLSPQPSQRTLAEGSMALDEVSQCRVYKPNLKASESVRWNGACKDGLAEGDGVATWFNHAKLDVIFEGSFSAGKLQGRGVMRGAEGDKYEGDYKDGKRHGVGVYVSSKGERYEGQYENNLRHGRGVLIAADGSRYDGEFRNGLKVESAASAATDVSAGADPQSCSSYWQLLGNILPQVRKYDAMLSTLAGAKNPTSVLNDFIATQGLLASALVSGEQIKGYADRLEFDGLGGRTAGVFLKALRVDQSSGLVFDKLIEIDHASSAKMIRQWPGEANGSPPVAVQGDELIFAWDLASVCDPQTSFTAYIAIRPDGSYRAVEKQNWVQPAEVSMGNCRADKFFPDSSYGSCMIYTDKGKQRWLVFEYPTT